MTTRNMNCGTTKTSVPRDNEVGPEIEAAAAAATATATAATTTNSTRITKTTTTITSDPGILCFHHCNVKVFCFTLPRICPQCKMALATHPNRDANSAGGVASSGGQRHKKKNTTKSNNNTNADQSPSINSKKDDNDANNVIDKNKNNAVAAAAAASDASDALDDSEDDDEQDEDDNDLSRSSLISNTMACRLLPFRLPYPFVRANQYPCAIVLRPTTGDFLNDYNNTTDLHIAVTTSRGYVVEFDRHGLRRHRTSNMSEWCQCLLVGDVPEPWYDYWDQVLFEICQQPDKWTVSHYHEDKYNCYTFVLNFLQALTYDKLSEAASSKTRFCEKYIVPKTTTAGKYISLYRKLRDAGLYVHHTNHEKDLAHDLERSHKTVKDQKSVEKQPATNKKQSNNRARHYHFVSCAIILGGCTVALTTELLGRLPSETF